MVSEEYKDRAEAVIKKEDAEKKEKNRKEFIRAIGVFSQLGVSMGACVIIGFFVGKFLDQKLGTGTPWLTVLFAFLGSASAIKMVYDTATKWK